MKEAGLEKAGNEEKAKLWCFVSVLVFVGISMRKSLVLELEKLIM